MSRVTKTISGGALWNLLPAAEAAGLSRAELVRQAGLTDGELDDPLARVSSAKLERAVRLLLARGVVAPPLRGDGLGWVEERLPVLASAWCNARTLRAALRAFVQYRSLVNEDGQVTVEEDGERVVAAYTLHGVPGADGYATFLAVGGLDLLTAVVRRYDPGGDTGFDLELEVPALPPDAHAQLARRFRGRLTLGGRTNAVAFACPFLDRPFPGHNSALQRTFLARLDEAQQQLDGGASLSLRVARSLRAVLFGAARGLSAEEVQRRVREELHETDWSLRRGLAREGVTFKELLLRSRVEEARRLLAGSALPVREIAQRLGFERQGSFTRFFRNEVGMTPLQFRQRGRRPRPR
jgi:AraC-like DNA-binding protein